MLSETAADVIRFFDRDFLDRLCLVSASQYDLVLETCTRYPLRLVRTVDIYRESSNEDISVYVTKDGLADHLYTREFPNLTAGLPYVGDIFRQSYVKRLTLHLDLLQRLKLSITSENWTTLMDCIGFGAVMEIQLFGANVANVTADAFVDITTRPGLKQLKIRSCKIPSGHVTGELLRSCVENEVDHLDISENLIMEGAYFRITEDDLLDFCFPIDGQHRDAKRLLDFEGCRTSNAFLSKLFKVNLSRSLWPKHPDLASTRPTLSTHFVTALNS